MPLRRIDRGRPPEQTDTLFTGFQRVYDPKRLWCNERGGEERHCGAKREVARRQPSGAARETAARQDSWRSDNQPAQVRRHKERGGGATREVAEQRERRRHDKRGTGAAREVTMQQPTAGAREAQRDRHWRGNSGGGVAIEAAAQRERGDGASREVAMATA